MKKICTLLLAAGMLFGGATGASAIDFKAKGQWIVGFGLVDNHMGAVHVDGPNRNDTFQAQQRVRIQVDAIASETLSGTVFFEIGDTTWGQAGGGQLGTDGIQVAVKRAYLDWIVPETKLHFRMGLQGLAMPSVAGGSAILDDDVAAVAANYQFNDMVGITFAWARPLNDNYVHNGRNGFETWYNESSNYLDNMDLFALILPVTGETWSVTPWIIYGMYGDNVDDSLIQTIYPGSSHYPASGLVPASGGWGNAFYQGGDGGGEPWRDADAPYTDMFFLGLPIQVGFGAANLELDLNYGSVGYSGTYLATHNSNDRTLDRRVDAVRSGWLIKGLFEYQMDWGTPGIFAWYGSGDDDDLENGSEMMPYIKPCGNFTSFMGDDPMTGWSVYGGYDNMVNYSGTWGIGLQLDNMSFVEDLSHTFRVAYWGGTNDSVNAQYRSYSIEYNAGTMYLTEEDYMVEFNLDSKYEIYENLDMVLQLGYIYNGMDEDTWSYVDLRDGYKAALIFNYTF